MGEVVRAPRPAKKESGGIEMRVTVVEGRMDDLEHTMAKHADQRRTENQATHNLLKTILERLGSPQTGPSMEATGLYWAVEQVSERVKPFESLWLQVKGSAKTIAFLAIPVGALIWFLSGAKLTALLHG